MHTRLALGVAATVAALSALVFSDSPAFADTGNFTLQGAGTISPGLTTTPAAQSLTFTGSGPLIDESNPALSGIYNCNFVGASSAPATLLVDQGTLTGSCAGPTTFGVDGSYARDGGFAVWTVTGRLNGGINARYTGVCSGLPTSGPTVTSYRLTCDLVLT